MTLNKSRLYRTALFLSLFTIFYNILEGIVCMYFGYNDETLTLFGFGADSFIEVVSGLGIFQMILRIRRHPGTPVSKFEIRALRITGVSFMVLALGLMAGIVVNFISHHKRKALFWEPSSLPFPLWSCFGWSSPREGLAASWIQAPSLRMPGAARCASTCRWSCFFQVSYMNSPVLPMLM